MLIEYRAGDVPSGGVRCAGDLSVPEGSGATRPLPAVVMGHNVHMVKEALAPCARYLLEAGFVVLAIDYRTIGSSEGQPRGQVFPGRYVEDVRNALTYLQSRSRWRSLAVSPPATEIRERGLRPEFTKAEPGTNHTHG